MSRPHERTLRRTLRSLRRRGVTAVVSALTQREVVHYLLGDAWPACTEAGIDYFWWPVPEYGLPSGADAAAFMPDLRDRLLAGEHVVVHCRLGLGRSPMIAAALLVELGFAANEAIDAVSVARGHRVPTQGSQRAWVASRAAANVGVSAAKG